MNFIGNVIEQLKEKASELTAQIDSLQKSIDSLFAEHASLTATTNEMLKQILKDSSSENLNDTMNTLYQKSDKIMSDIRESNVLVKEYQYIRHYINLTIEMLEEKPSDFSFFINSLLRALQDLKTENLAYGSSDSLSFAIFWVNDEIKSICFYLNEIRDFNPAFPDHIPNKRL